MTRTVRQLAALARYPLQRKRTFIALLVIAMLTTGLLVRYADALYWLFKYGSGIIEVIAQDIGNALTTEILWNNAGTVDGISTFTTNGSTVTGTGTLNMSGGTVSLPTNAVDALAEINDAIQSATDANSTDIAMVGSGFTGNNQCVQRNANGALETTGSACGEGGGGGTPGGADTQLQYNNAGSFDGVTGFTSTDGINITGTGNITTTGAATVNSLTLAASAIPTIPLRDADLIASDKTIAEITGNATDTGDGTEDADVTVAAMRAGVMTARVTIDGDGSTAIPFLQAPLCGGSPPVALPEREMCQDLDNNFYVGDGDDLPILIGPGGGLESETQDLDDVVGQGATATGRDSASNAIIVEGEAAAGSVRLFVDSNGPHLRGFDDAGNPLSMGNVEILDGETVIETIGNGSGVQQTCRTKGNDGTITYAAVESCRPTKSVTIPSGAMSPDGTQCTAVAAAAINSGPIEPLITCADNNAGTIWAVISNMPKSWNGGTITVTLSVFSDNATPSGDYDIDFAASCRLAGAPINATVGTEMAADIDFDASGSCGGSACDQYDVAYATTAAITPNGTCTAGAERTLYIRGQVDATGTTATVADVFILGIKVEYVVTSTSD